MNLKICLYYSVLILGTFEFNKCEGQLFKNLFGKLYGKLSKNEKHNHHHNHNKPEPMLIDDQAGMYQDFVKNVLPFLPAPTVIVPLQTNLNSPNIKKVEAKNVNSFRGPVGSNGLPLPPYIRLGGSAPPGFRVVNNFKESFEVRLPPIVSQDSNRPNPSEKTIKNLGSIMSQSKIYISPEYPVLQRPPNVANSEVRSPPFSESEAVIELFNSVSDIMHEKVKQVSKNQLRSFHEEKDHRPNVNDDPSRIERPVVIVHLQSYSSIRPNLTKVDWDVMDAQSNYGFGCGAFEFGKTETVAHILKSLGQSNIENIDINEIGDSQDEINENVFSRFNKFVNSTRKVHLWSHTRSEVDAIKRFRLPFLEGGYVDGPIGKNFQDTAPVTDTLAVAFL